ncbi:MAG TPA: hypothetical protein VK909_06805 [Anaerolineales bacterium]|nr:hypothetical protein [Anaerolineales bacterium]
MMSRLPQYILWGEDVIGNVSAYSALPTALCPGCGSKLYRVYNTQTAWKYLCRDEKVLVDPENALATLQVEIE